MKLNYIQTPIESLEVEKAPQEIQDQFYDIINNIPFVRRLISSDRPRAKDLPRDSEGKIIVDITKPHILEDMDYFRQTAIYYQKNGKYTDLRPNANPNSDYGKWLRQEVYRCWNGMIRESDGEWIPGDYYFLLNYIPILQTEKRSDGSNSANRIIDFPRVFEGHYYKFHYLDQARKSGHHAAELAKRGCGKSIGVASMMAKRFVLGESNRVKKKVTCYITATDKSKLVGGDQTLDKFQFDIDFLAENTQFPSKRLINSIQNMQWQMGYLDLDSGAKKGTLNSVVGKSSQADASKLRGSRGVLYIFEESGTFQNLLQTYNNLRPSVEDGSNVFGLLYMVGTAGDSESDFTSMQEIMYHPDGYNVYGVENVYDREGQGRPKFSYFFPGYLNREGCYDHDGNSDVIKAIWEILWDRYKVKYNSSDINSVTKRIAEIPITPQEAIIRSRGNMFPVTELNARLAQIDNNPAFFDETYVGELYYDKENHVEFKPTADKPIRDFPLKDNKADGAIEIFKMPEAGSDGKIFRNRYIIGVDPIDDDEADTMSLYSNFVLDLWTDTIVAEYTGRLQYADSCYEITRKLAFFYNAKVIYESNKKGIYAYFSRMNCTHLLAETPEYLRDKDLIKQTGIGNKAYGVNATKPINDYANRLIRDWLLKEVPIIETIEGEEVESSTFNLFRLNNRALIKELILFNGDINVDRVRALGMVMLYREQFMVTYGGDFRKAQAEDLKNYIGNDDYFKRNFDNRFNKTNPIKINY